MPVAKGRNHVFMHVLIRRRLIVELHKTHGYSMDDARQMVGDLGPDEIDAGIAQTAGANEALKGVGTVGDWIQKFLDFLASPAGQALIALLIKILLGGALAPAPA